MKKVAIIADGWRKFVNYAWMGGCRQYIKENNSDVNLYVFHSFGDYSMDEKYNIGEYNIVRLPNFADFDGIILELTNVTNPEVKEQIIRKARESGVPTVSLLEEFDGCFFSGTDNHSAMSRIVRHLIDVHDCRVLNFVGGPLDNAENLERFQAYKDVLKSCGIPYSEERVFFRNFEIETGILAFDEFQSRGKVPQAFVCANDNIAIGICHRAEDFGYKVPQDFLVTGYDNFDKASFYEPRITTAGFVREDISYRAMGLLHDIWEGGNKKRRVYSKVNCIFQDSCGCISKEPRSRGRYVVERIFSEDDENKMQNEILMLKREMLNCESFARMAACIPKNLTTLQYDALYILVNEEIASCGDYSSVEMENETQYRVNGYPDDMTVLLSDVRDHVGREDLSLKAGRLIPGAEEKEGGHLFLFSPLHFRDREVGYIVMKNCDYLMDSQMLFEVLNTFQETMENMYHRVILKRMNEELSLLYIRDSLTGLYNRMAYSRLAVPLFEKCMDEGKPLLILFIDLDRLKYINDTFGHDMGNIAIKAIAGTLQRCSPEEAVAMRYGGDEFVVLVPNYTEKRAETLVKEITTQIKKQKKLLNTAFPIEASIGYAVTTEKNMKSLNDYINLADERMYSVKKEKKAERI
ncbi:MAG: GGDEF domain-containing protein [Lachnospiraceae bacterium]|nr:GGDEF domain-containing protein [Lachnospiraceae bacterium]